MRQNSHVQRYPFHSNHPIEQSIYLSKEGEELLPISIQPQQHPEHPHNQHIAHSHTSYREKKVTISQVNTQRESRSIWDIFGCCKEDTVISTDEYDDCYVCNRRVFHNQGEVERGGQEEKPYTSAYRMRSRQEQPVQVFYDRLHSQQLKGERWREQ